MNLANALSMLQQGCRMTRSSWDSQRIVYLDRAVAIDSDLLPDRYVGTGVLKIKAPGNSAPAELYLGSDDLLALDWEIVR